MIGGIRKVIGGVGIEIEGIGGTNGRRGRRILVGEVDRKVTLSGREYFLAGNHRFYSESHGKIINRDTKVEIRDGLDIQVEYLMIITSNMCSIVVERNQTIGIHRAANNITNLEVRNRLMGIEGTTKAVDVLPRVRNRVSSISNGSSGVSSE